MTRILWALMIFSSVFFSVARAETPRAQDIRQMIQTLGLDGSQTDSEVVDFAKKVFSTQGTLSCRGDGFDCTNSIECCSYCFQGSCGGNTHDKPDGASCESSIECHSYCFQGVCGGNTHDKPDGASCESSIECHTYCFQGRCGGN